MTESHAHTNYYCVNNISENFGGISQTTSNHKTMHSAYANKKEPIYFQMTELEVATVFTTAAKTILWQMVCFKQIF